MKKQVGVGWLMAWVAVFCLAGAAQAVKFRYENLGTLGGSQSYAFFDGKQAGINDAGQVAGMSYTGAGALHAFVKSPGQAMLDLGGLIAGSGYSYAPCLNNSGVVGGWYNDGSGYPHACKWAPQSGRGYNFINLGAAGSLGRGLNDSGYFVGGTATNGQVWPPEGTPQVLGILPGHAGCTATAINQANTVVGYAWSGTGVFTACYWSPSGSSFSEPSSLFGVADSRAFAINNSGQSVGYVYVREFYQFHAVLKSPGQELQDLGSLYPGFDALAHDINDSGQIVGEADNFSGTNAFLWTPTGGMQNLNNLALNLPTGVRLVTAMAINKRGEIAGYTANGVFKLTPVSGPPLSLLLLD